MHENATRNRNMDLKNLMFWILGKYGVEISMAIVSILEIWRSVSEGRSFVQYQGDSWIICESWHIHNRDDHGEPNQHAIPRVC